MSDVDIVARFALKSSQFAADTNKLFSDVTGKARNTGLQIKAGLGSAFRDIANDATSSIPLIGSELALLNGPLALVAAGAAAFGLAFTKGLQEAEAFGKSVRQLDGVLEATGNKTGYLRDQLIAFAEEAEGRLAIPAEDIMKTQAALATFDGVAGPIFQRTIEAAADMSAVFGGDLQTNSEKLGTVLQNLAEGNVEGLGRGFKFLGTETLDLVSKLAETGKTAQAQEKLLTELEARLGGQGEAAAGGLTGATFRLKDAWGDLLRTFGEGRSGEIAIGWIDELSQKIADMQPALQNAIIGWDALVNGRNPDAAVREAALGVTDKPGSGKVKGGRGGGAALGTAFGGGYSEKATSAAADKEEAARKKQLAEAERGRQKAMREAETAREKALQKEIQLLQDQGAAVQDLLAMTERLRGNFSADFDARLEEAYRAFNPQSNISTDVGLDSLQQSVDKAIEGAFGSTTDKFRDDGIMAAQAIAQAFGGKVGGEVSKIAGLVRGLSTGDFTSVGGPVGGALTLFSQNKETREALKDTFGPLVDEVGKGLEGIAADLGLSGGGTLVGSAVAGFGIGSAMGGNIESGIGGAIGSTAGSAIGMAVGGPVGAAIGSAIGSLVGGAIGGLFAGPKKGSVTLGSSGGEFTVGAATGNSASRREAATALGGGVADSLNQIADLLGADIGSFAVSVGQRDGVFSVDPTGRGMVSKKYGAVQFDSAEEAARYAINDAIKDGAFTGLTATVVNALRNASTLEKGLDDAVLIQSVAKRLAAIDDPMGAALEELNDEFEDLRDTMISAGATAAELADAERLYGEERKRLVEAEIATLKDFQSSLNVGSGSPLSLTDQRGAAETAFAALEADILAGRDFDQGAFTKAAQDLLDVERQINGGTASFFDQFNRVQSLTSKAIADLENVSAIREGPFAQKTADATQRTADTTAALLNATNTAIQQNNLIIAALKAMGGGAGGYNDAASRGYVRVA